MPKLTRITRSERLTPEEAKRYQEVREKIDQELPELIKRHHDRMESGSRQSRIIEQHNGWALVAHENPLHGFNQESPYRMFCANCGRHMYAHFRGNAPGCSNSLDIKNIPPGGEK